MVICTTTVVRPCMTREHPKVRSHPKNSVRAGRSPSRTSSEIPPAILIGRGKKRQPGSKEGDDESNEQEEKRRRGGGGPATQGVGNGVAAGRGGAAKQQQIRRGGGEGVGTTVKKRGANNDQNRRWGRGDDTLRRPNRVNGSQGAGREFLVGIVRPS